MVNPAASSTAEVVAELIKGLGVTMTEDISTNLLNALVSATNNFQNPNVTAEAFELAAALMKTGGKRFPPKAEPPVDTKPVVSEEVPTTSGESVAHEPQKIESTVQPASVAAPVQKPAAPAPVTQPAKKQVAPPDWLKPKIFKSTNIS